MKVIHKQNIDFRNGSQIAIKVPVASKLFSCDFQIENLVVWYMFDPLHQDNLVVRSLYVVRTGEVSPDFIDSPKLKFIGTAHDRSAQPFVLHVFEILNH